MKKYLFALTVILFGMFVLVSCDKEDEIKGRALKKSPFLRTKTEKCYDL